MKRFENKNVVITGGTSGIGLASAKRLTEEGAKVLVTGTNEERLQKVRDTIPGAIALENDASVVGSEKTLAEAVKEHFGRIDGLYLNAGFGRMQGLPDVTAEEFDAEYHVNVRAPLLQTRELAPLMNDGGSILLTASVAKSLGMEGMAIYSSTKGAVRSLTRTLARELAARKIRVNAVSPGPIGTDFFNRAGLDEQTIEEFAEQIKAKVPLDRFGESEEVAAVAAFLLSSEASYVTGTDYVVDGGMTQL